MRAAAQPPDDSPVLAAARELWVLDEAAFAEAHDGVVARPWSAADAMSKAEYLDKAGRVLAAAKLAATSGRRRSCLAVESMDLALTERITPDLAAVLGVLAAKAAEKPTMPLEEAVALIGDSLSGLFDEDALSERLVPRSFVVQGTTVRLFGRDYPAPVMIEGREQRDGGIRWAVTLHCNVLHRDGSWSIEPTPSSRTDEYLAETRFATPAEALAALDHAIELEREREERDGPGLQNE